MRTFLTRHLPAILWAAVVGVVLVLPGSAFASITRRIPEWFEGWIDKGIHAVLFLVLAVLLLRSVQAIEALRRPVSLVLVATLAYAVFLEFVQTGLPGRGLDPLDLVAGGVGTLVGLLIAGPRPARPARRPAASKSGDR